MSTVRKDTTFLKNRYLNIRGELREFARPLIMGIINLTPDSFYDGGALDSNEKILEQASQMMEEGADILDIGAYSSRPGAEDISQETEIERLIKPIELIRKEYPNTILSVDTFRSQVVKLAVESGADIINDISGGSRDAEMLNLATNLKVPYIMMHMKATPQDMQENPLDEESVSEVYKYFSQRIQSANEVGLSDVIIDPGFGFGKTLTGNYSLLKHLSEFKVFNCLILAGISRKSMVGKITNTSPADSLYGTIALNTIALQNGADILRVHDVKAAKEAIDIHSFYQKV